jgi:hypothetical protein
MGENAMNERIRELAEQAKEHAINRLDETGELHKYYDVYFEKFAELIVKECVNINQQELAFNAFEQLMNRYNDHFGVDYERTY